MFPAGSNQQVALIDTFLDNIGEGAESFTAVLSSPSAGVMLAPGGEEATVNITDNTNVVVEFDPVTYIVGEEGVFATFRIVKITTSTRSVSVLFNTADVDAEGNSLYSFVEANISYPRITKLSGLSSIQML